MMLSRLHHLCRRSRGIGLLPYNKQSVMRASLDSIRQPPTRQRLVPSSASEARHPSMDQRGRRDSDPGGAGNGRLPSHTLRGDFGISCGESPKMESRIAVIAELKKASPLKRA